MSSQIAIGPGEYQTDEREAAADVEPGELVEFAADGRVQPHSTAAGQTVTRFAKEARNVGKTIDDTYGYDADADEGENVHFGYPAPGTPVPGAFLAAGENVDPDTPLVSAGDGSLRALDTAGGDDESAVVAYSNEATDNSGGSEAVRHEVISA